MRTTGRHHNKKGGGWADSAQPHVPLRRQNSKRRVNKGPLWGGQAHLGLAQAEGVRHDAGDVEVGVARALGEAGGIAHRTAGTHARKRLEGRMRQESILRHIQDDMPWCARNESFGTIVC